MATTPQKKNSENKAPEPQPGDPLFTLHHAQAEAALAEKNGGLGPTTNVYVTNEEEENIDEATAPRDSQGFRRGESDSDLIGSNAGDHK